MPSCLSDFRQLASYIETQWKNAIKFFPVLRGGGGGGGGGRGEGVAIPYFCRFIFPAYSLAILA